MSAMVYSSFFMRKTAVPSFWRIRWLAALKRQYRQEAVNILPKDGKWLVQEKLFDRVVLYGNVRQLGGLFPAVG